MVDGCVFMHLISIRQKSHTAFLRNWVFMILRFLKPWNVALKFANRVWGQKHVWLVIVDIWYLQESYNLSSKPFFWFTNVLFTLFFKIFIILIYQFFYYFLIFLKNNGILFINKLNFFIYYLNIWLEFTKLANFSLFGDYCKWLLMMSYRVYNIDFNIL